MVGASLAGIRSVEAARKAGYDGVITLIGSERHLPYDRPPLSKNFLRDNPAPGPQFFRTEHHLTADLGVDLRLGYEAVGLDPDRREVSVANGDQVPYTELVIATGARARHLPGTDHLGGVHTLRTLDDARAIRAAIDGGARKIVIVGAGFIGSEVAATIRKRGLPVTILELAPVPLVRSVGEQMGQLCAQLHALHGTTLLCGHGIGHVEGEGRVTGLRLTDGTLLDCDLLIVGVGAAPATEWLNGAGLDLDDGVVCDTTLQTNVAGIYVKGQ